MSSRDRIHRSSLRRPLRGAHHSRDFPVEGRGRTRNARAAGDVEPKYGVGRSLRWTEESALDADRRYGAGFDQRALDEGDRYGRRAQQTLIRRGDNYVGASVSRSKYARDPGRHPR
jgi:hypothetical protein